MIIILVLNCVTLGQYNTVLLIKQMLKPPPQPQSPYKKQLKQIARIAQYEPVASIPQPCHDFNYTIARNRYSQYYETPKIIKKQPVNRSDNLKLTTILQTHGGSPLFPKIAKNKVNCADSGQQIKNRVKGLRTHFKRQENTTVASRQRSLTVDTRFQTEQDRKQNYENDFLLESVESKRNKGNSSQIYKKSMNSYSNSTQLPAMNSRKNLSLKKHVSKSEFIIPLNQEEQEGCETEEQYQKDAVPGPGSYQFSYSDFDKKRSTASTNVSFLSKLTRFRYKNQDKSAEQPLPRNPLSVQKQLKRQERMKIVSRRKIIPFNSLSPRSFELEKRIDENIPGPQQYYIRQGMEQDLIRVIQRQFKGNFGSHQPRFAQNKGETHLGPGYYDKPSEQDPLSNENFYFKSKKSRFQK